MGIKGNAVKYDNLKPMIAYTTNYTLWEIFGIKITLYVL